MRPLEPQRVDLWLVDLPPAQFSPAPWLSPDETARAATCPDFGAARSRLRWVLAQYLGGSPAALAFDYGAYGRPALRGAPLHFSVARRSGRALFGVGLHRRLGVDLERPGPLPELAGITAMLHADEQAALAAHSSARRLDAFYRCWTRKEALLKALGCGLSDGLSTVAVEVGETDDPQILDFGEAAGAAGLRLKDLPAARPFLGAVAAPAAVNQWTLLRWRAGAADLEVSGGL